jgi:AraC-like DNA-binding protein
VVDLLPAEPRRRRTAWGDIRLGAGPPGGQSYRERRPVPALAGLVSSVWVQEVPPGARPYLHRNVPNGSVEIRCYLGRVPQVVGPLTRPLTETLPPGSTIVGLRFRPGAASGALGVPASELADLVLDAEHMWGDAAVAIGERLAASAGPGAAVAALQQGVAGQLAATDGPDMMIAAAIRRLTWGQPRDVGPVRASLWVSERQFRRRCLAAVGVPPKTLQRMLRFQGFLARVQFAVSRGGGPLSEGLARLAADCGYADQAHLSRECVRLTGVTPGLFLHETEQSCGGGHEHEASFGPLLHRGG